MSPRKGHLKGHFLQWDRCILSQSFADGMKITCQAFAPLVTSFLASIVAWFERTVSSLCCISVHAPTQNLVHHMGRARLNLAVCMMLALLTPVQADTAAAQTWHHDLGSGCSHTYQVRKRAMLRAIARAKKHPERGTWYRNRWHHLQTLVGNYRSLPTRVVDTERRPRPCAKLSPEL